MVIIYNKVLMVFFMFLYSIIAFLHTCEASSNIALGKSYSISERLNYPHTALSNDVTVLTDGIYSTGMFWLQKSTAGWQGKKTVEILIDLEKNSLIDNITFNTARNLKDVFFPAHVYAFSGPDKERLVYIGDIVNNSDNIPGEYKVKRFSLNNIGVKGRYVLLVVEVKGFYLFCDEIEVFEGNKEKIKTGNLTLDAARKYAEQIKKLDIDKELLNGLTAAMHSEVDSRADSVISLAKINQKISNLMFDDKTESIEAEIFSLRGVVLRENYPGKQLLVKNIDPWKSIPRIFSPVSGQISSMSLVMPKNGHDFAAIVITNTSTDSRQITVSFEKNSSISPEVSLFSLPFIKSASLEYIADPLVPLADKLTFLPGESKIIYLMAHGVTPGTWQKHLKISNAQATISIPVKIHILKLALTEPFAVNSVNWGYLDSNPIINRKNNAAHDLLIHHTNVVVVPPKYIPFANLINPTDFKQLESYLSLHHGANKVIFYMAYNSSNRLTFAGKFQFMDAEWKGAFRQWYSGILSAAAKAGFKEDQLYLYPFDEMSTKDVNMFIPFASWVKKDFPGIKLYATINIKESLNAVPYLDVAQIHNTDELLNSIKSTKTELWLYDTRKPAKSLSPYSYYRLLAWKAFYRNFKGIGFWAYADASGSVWDDFDGQYPDYAVIYDGEGDTIVSSRRWEAWRMGLEDYELLTMYARKRGESAAKALAKGVLDKPDDTTRADLVRRQILDELSR